MFLGRSHTCAFVFGAWLKAAWLWMGRNHPFTDISAMGLPPRRLGYGDFPKLCKNSQASILAFRKRTARDRRKFVRIRQAA